MNRRNLLSGGLPGDVIALLSDDGRNWRAAFGA